jgi:acyl-CoA thioesterase
MERNDPAIERLGIELLEAAPGRAVAAMTVTEDMLNSHGVCHGGLLFLLADTTMDYATNSGDEMAFAAHAEVDYLRPAMAGDRVIATGITRDRWGRTTLLDATIAHAETGVVIAQFRGRTRTTGTRT